MAVGPIFALLHIGFGIGMWQSAHRRHPVRMAGALMVGHGAMMRPRLVALPEWAALILQARLRSTPGNFTHPATGRPGRLAARKPSGGP